MSAIVRVKRRCDEEPLDALVLNCKKRKTEEPLDDGEITVLKFAGTLKNQEEDVFKHIKKPTKSELEDTYKKHLTVIRDKIRDENQTASKNNRFKVVNLYRSGTDNGSAPKEENHGVMIVDIETDPAHMPTDSKAKHGDDYVYDYYTCSDDLREFYDHELSVFPLSDELVYGSYRDNGITSEMADSDDSEDSNAENNWRNDYPDEMDDESVTEEDMLAAMKRVDLESADDLSSDEGEEGFVYSIDSEGAGFEEDIDDSDVNRYGERYARFRARNKEKKSDFVYFEDAEDDEDDNPYY